MEKRLFDVRCKELATPIWSIDRSGCLNLL